MTTYRLVRARNLRFKTPLFETQPPLFYYQNPIHTTDGFLFVCSTTQRNSSFPSTMLGQPWRPPLAEPASSRNRDAAGRLQRSSGLYLVRLSCAATRQLHMIRRLLCPTCRLCFCAVFDGFNPRFSVAVGHYTYLARCFN